MAIMEEQETTSSEPAGAAESGTEAIYLAPQWKMVWWKFKNHRVALWSVGVLAAIYTLAIFCGFFAPYTPGEYSAQSVYQPPQLPRIFHEGRLSRPFVYTYQMERDPETRRENYVRTDERRFLTFFTKGPTYKLIGLFETDLHLFGVESGRVYLLGADRLGRDLFSRLLYGARVSTTIGFVGVFLSLFLGILIGGVAGYYGGWIDNAAQRLMEFLRSIPTIPLWMGLSAALPPDWGPIQVYFGITVILSVRGWTPLGRQVRSKFLSLREEDFVVAARLTGARKGRIIFVHMLPSFVSHIIASMTLAIPGMILGETALSFLGLGIRSPAVSWGSLLQEAQNIRSVVLAPWLMLPALAVVITVLAFNYLGDGLRDAADPYGR